MTNLEKIKKVLTEAKVPFTFSKLHITLSVEEFPRDLYLSMDFDEVTGKFVGLGGKCWKDHPDSYNYWDL